MDTIKNNIELEDIKDILLELKDEGFTINIEEDFNDINIIIRIYKLKSQTELYSFPFKILKEYLDKILSYYNYNLDICVYGEDNKPYFEIDEIDKMNIIDFTGWLIKI